MQQLHCICSIMHDLGNLCKAYKTTREFVALHSPVSLFIILTKLKRKAFSNHVSVISPQISFSSQAETLPGL